MVAQAHGAGDEVAVGRSTRQALWLATILAIPGFILLRQAPQLLILLGQEASTVALTDGYLEAISWATLPLLWFGVLRHLVEGLSRPRVVTIITAIGVLVNISANWVLMYGKFGLPAMGLRGCGWASTLVYWMMLAALLVFIVAHRDFRTYAIFSKLGKPDRDYFIQLLKIGWPIGVSHGLEMGLFATTAFLMGVLGVEVLAAHQIALQSAAYTFMVPMGLSIATSVRVGQAVGAGKMEHARRAGFVGIGLGAAFMFVAALVFWFAPRTVIALFVDVNQTGNATLVEMAVRLLGLAAVFQVFDGIQVTSMGALRGLKDTRMPMLIALIAYWLIGLPGGYFFAFNLEWNAPGLWWGLVLGLGSAAIMLFWRFWKAIRPQP
jgi:MATE family multidrug resistance protein